MKKVKLKVNNFSEEKVKLISSTFNITEISAKILLNRGLNTVEDINNFLDPELKYLENTDNFKDVNKACERILKALENKEKILIYGDYDVDGATSISQFILFLKKIKANVDYYVPERENEGYGISEDFLNSIVERNINLLITVDCGISEVNAIDRINESGIDTILIDHHQCGEIIPRAYAVINPKQKDCPSKNKNLCASGLCYKFLLHLNRYLKIEGIEDILLELACLGTIADIVDLIEDNRIITFNGLKNINNSKLIGLNKLIEKAGISDRVIEAFHIGYILAPRINAAGRMASARKAVELLLADNEQDAEALADELEGFNTLRKQIEQEIFNEAIEKIERDFLYKKNLIVVSGDNWHEGVLGIVSSRITEKYDKPSLVISIDGDMAKASARSLEYLNMFEALNSVSHLLIKYGGHKLAAGFTLKKASINELSIELNKFADKILDKKEIEKIIEIDSFIKIKDINENLYSEICRFEPFGHGNPKPSFAVADFNILELKRVGKDKKHISFLLKDNESSIKVIGFDKIRLLEMLLIKPETLVVNISENEFRGNIDLQLVLQNVEHYAFEKQEIDPNKSKIIYSVINKSKSKIIKTDIFDFAETISRVYNTDITAADIVRILNSENKLEYIMKNDILYIKK